MNHTTRNRHRCDLCGIKEKKKHNSVNNNVSSGILLFNYYFFAACDATDALSQIKNKFLHIRLVPSSLSSSIILLIEMHFLSVAHASIWLACQPLAVQIIKRKREKCDVSLTIRKESSFHIIQQIIVAKQQHNSLCVARRCSSRISSLCDVSNGFRINARFLVVVIFNLFESEISFEF